MTARARAIEMKKLPKEVRDAAIDEGENVIDARRQFEFRNKQARLAREYRKGRKSR